MVDKITEFSSRKTGVTIELIALGSAIEHCFRLSQEVQAKFQHGLHQIVDSSIHATRKELSNPDGPNQREKLCDKTKLNEAALDQMLRFEPAESRTHEGKFNFLIQQKRHVLTPQISVIMSTQKLDINHPGY